MVTWQSTEPYWANESPQLEPAGTDSEDLALIGRGNIGPCMLLLGFACGYGLREYISRRRRALERRKFERGERIFD
jgi:hypothetical protein